MTRPKSDLPYWIWTALVVVLLGVLAAFVNLFGAEIGEFLGF